MPIHSCVTNCAWNGEYMCHRGVYFFLVLFWGCTFGEVYVPCNYSHARWSNRTRSRSLLLCPLSVVVSLVCCCVSCLLLCPLSVVVSLVCCCVPCLLNTINSPCVLIFSRGDLISASAVSKFGKKIEPKSGFNTVAIPTFGHIVGSLQTWRSRLLQLFRSSKNNNNNRSIFSLSLIHIWRCRRDVLCRSRWSPYH